MLNDAQKVTSVVASAARKELILERPGKGAPARVPLGGVWSIAALPTSSVLEQISMVGRMRDFGQLQERTHDIKVQKGFVILPLAAKANHLTKVEAHGIDGRLDMLVPLDASRHGAWLGCGLQRQRLPLGFRPIYLRVAGILGVRDARSGGKDQSSGNLQLHRHRPFNRRCDQGLSQGLLQ
jgi:hypothetical protein